MPDPEQTNLTALTVDLLRSYFANNTVEHTEIADVIRSTHDALKAIENPEPEAPTEPEFTAKVGVRKSLGSPEHIISMIDGKPYKTLKRHLASHDLTPAQYRERYKLPSNYPMVAPAYSEQRRAVAAKLGLGRKPTNAAPQAAVQAAAVAPVVAEAPAKAVKAPAKTRTAAKPRAKTPTTPKPAPAKNAVAAKAAPAPAAQTTAAPVAPASAKVSAPAKAARKPKAAAAAATETKTPAKRAPRKAKAPSETPAS